MEPLVSIVTTVYNGEQYVDDYFERISEINYKSIEVIIVNDGSKDSTKEKILKHQKHMEECGYRFLILEQDNGGQAKALSKALPYIHGKYFVLLDIDDYLLENAIAERVAVLDQNEDIGFVISNGFSEKGGRRTRVFENGISDTHYLSDVVRGKYIINLAYMFRTEVLRRINPELKISQYRAGQNLQIILPYAMNSRFCYLDEAQFVRLLHEDSHSNRAAVDDYQKKRCRAQELLLIKMETLVPLQNADCWLPRIVIQYNAEDCLNSYSCHDYDKARLSEKQFHKCVREAVKEILHYQAVLMKMKILRMLGRV